jgi:glutamate N-acetyltransferase/amino-acid N-acetyltransferase
MSKKSHTVIEGGVTAAKGFSASAMNVGIRSTKLDLAIIASDREAVVAGTFTTNLVHAAPVKLCKANLAGGHGRAIVINSGNANACTGPQGMEDARRMGTLTAQALGVDEKLVYVCSTGTIGIPMPMAKVEAGIPKVAAALSPAGGADVARAIMTTDTVPKEIAVQVEIDGVPVRIGGITKGAGMISPNMATMLCFITTDAAVEQRALQAALSAAVDDTFNGITIDGDQSTNDTVLVLANGAAGNATLSAAHPAWAAFEGALRHVCSHLATAIVKDGEGATKLVTLTVTGAATREDARLAARAVATSMLCKTAWFGGDPNWGRIIAAVGRSGANVAEDRVGIRFDGSPVVRAGCLAPGASLKDLARIFAQKAFTIEIDLGIGAAHASVLTCDCSIDYVKINAEYMT